MREVILNFPDSDSLAEFVLVNQLSHAIISGLNLSAILTEEQIVSACTGYKAVLMKSLVLFETV